MGKCPQIKIALNILNNVLLKLLKCEMGRSRVRVGDQQSLHKSQKLMCVCVCVCACACACACACVCVCVCERERC